MTTQILSFLSFALGMFCYSISQLQQHGKLRWSKKGLGFWDFDSDKRKYISKIPFAKTALVFLTDGYHLCQFCFFLFVSLGISIALQLENWKQYLFVWICDAYACLSVSICWPWIRITESNDATKTFKGAILSISGCT